MIKIIKMPDASQERNYTCPHCGCEFIATNDEIHNGMIECPCCDGYVSAKTEIIKQSSREDKERERIDEIMSDNEDIAMINWDDLYKTMVFVSKLSEDNPLPYNSVSEVKDNCKKHLYACLDIAKEYEKEYLNGGDVEVTTLRYNDDEYNYIKSYIGFTYFDVNVDIVYKNGVYDDTIIELAYSPFYDNNC